MECAAEFGVAAFHKGRVSAWQLLLVSCADHPCVLMEKKKNLFTGVTTACTQGHIIRFWICALYDAAQIPNYQVWVFCFTPV